MVLASPNDQKYPRYSLVLKSNVTVARPLRLVILIFFKWKILSDDRRLYLHDSKWNSRYDVDGLTHTKQLLNLLCIVYITPQHNACLPTCLLASCVAGCVVPCQRPLRNPWWCNLFACVHASLHHSGYWWHRAWLSPIWSRETSNFGNHADSQQVCYLRLLPCWCCLAGGWCLICQDGVFYYTRIYKLQDASKTRSTMHYSHKQILLKTHYTSNLWKIFSPQNNYHREHGFKSTPF